MGGTKFNPFHPQEKVVFPKKYPLNFEDIIKSFHSWALKVNENSLCIVCTAFFDRDDLDRNMDFCKKSMFQGKYV